MTGTFEDNKMMADAALALSIQQIADNAHNTVAQARKRIVIELQFACA